MPRLTITLSEESHQALKEAAARCNKSIEVLIEEILIALATNGIWREPVRDGTEPGAPDADEHHLWDLLGTRDAPVLVTGDQLLLDNPPPLASVISPRSFVEWSSGS